MAIWQFHLALFPRAGTMPRRTDDGYEVPAVQASKVSQARIWLEGHFGSPALVLEGWLLYGLENGNRIDVSVNEDGSAELSARIDANSNPPPFIRKLVELSQLVECGLFSPEYWEPIEVSAEAIRLALERSRAMAYVKDPIKVLRGADSGA